MNEISASLSSPPASYLEAWPGAEFVQQAAAQITSMENDAQ